jgi:hypothetical protein
MNSEFDLKLCKLVVRDCGGVPEVFVDAGHADGVIFLAKGKVQLAELGELLKKTHDANLGEPKLARILKFIKQPATVKQIRDRYGSCDSALKALESDGAARRYHDENPVVVKGSGFITTWYVATGKEYTKHRKSKTYSPRIAPIKKLNN